MKVWEKWDKLFKTLTVCEKRVGSVKVCEFCGLQSAREKLSVYWSETFLRPNSSLNKNNCRTESEGTHFLSVLTDKSVSAIGYSKGCTPFGLYQMCGRVAYLHVAFPSHIAKVCEKFVNFERIFLYEPWCLSKVTVRDNVSLPSHAHLLHLQLEMLLCQQSHRWRQSQS